MSDLFTAGTRRPGDPWLAEHLWRRALLSSQEEQEEEKQKEEQEEEEEG